MFRGDGGNISIEVDGSSDERTTVKPIQPEKNAATIQLVEEINAAAAKSPTDALNILQNDQSQLPEAAYNEYEKSLIEKLDAENELLTNINELQEKAQNRLNIKTTELAEFFKIHGRHLGLHDNQLGEIQSALKELEGESSLIMNVAKNFESFTEGKAQLQQNLIKVYTYLVRFGLPSLALAIFAPAGIPIAMSAAIAAGVTGFRATDRINIQNKDNIRFSEMQDRLEDSIEQTKHHTLKTVMNASKDIAILQNKIAEQKSARENNPESMDPKIIEANEEALKGLTHQLAEIIRNGKNTISEIEDRLETNKSDRDVESGLRASANRGNSAAQNLLKSGQYGSRQMRDQQTQQWNQTLETLGMHSKEVDGLKTIISNDNLPQSAAQTAMLSSMENACDIISGKPLNLDEAFDQLAEGLNSKYLIGSGDGAAPITLQKFAQAA